MHGTAPKYLSDYCVPVADLSSRLRLRSAAAGKLIIQRARTNMGQRSFGVSGPTIWNSLPDDLRDPELSLQNFQKKLKTALFNKT